MSAKDKLAKIEAEISLMRSFQVAFKTPEGKRVLAWILETGGFDAGLPARLTPEERGAQDLTRLIFTQCYRADPGIVTDLIESWAFDFKSELNRSTTELQEQIKEE